MKDFDYNLDLEQIFSTQVYMLEIDFDFRGDPLGGQISDCKQEYFRLISILISFSSLSLSCRFCGEGKLIKLITCENHSILTSRHESRDMRFTG